MNEKLRDELAVEHENACYRIEPWKEVTHAESFKAGWNACHDEDMKAIKSITKDDILEVITKWKFKWMDVKGTDERDRENYYSRAFGVDANMKHSIRWIDRILLHDLARMILEFLESRVK